MDAARAAIKDNRAPSNAGRRFWELSGGLVRCGLCDRVMDSQTTANPGRPIYFYYACRTRYKKGAEGCPNGKYHAAARIEARVWERVSRFLKDPDRLRADLDDMIESQRNNLRGDPAREAKLWADKLAEAESKRARYQEMAASDLITFDELKAKLTELDDTRATAERELKVLRNHEQRVADLEKNRDAVLAYLLKTAPEALDELSPEERRRFYKMLKLRASLYPDGSFYVEFSGAIPNVYDVRKPETAKEAVFWVRSVNQMLSVVVTVRPRGCS